VRSSRAALLVGFALWSLAAPARAASPPYPPSEVVTGIAWETGTYRWSGGGGDIWPVTWAADGPLVTAWGDGLLGCRRKASYGVARITAEQPATAALRTVHCGPGPMHRGKVWALVATPGRLWAAMSEQAASSFGGHPIWLSTDGGRSWDAPADPLAFRPDSFVQFGQGNAGAPGGYVYLFDSTGTAARLIRAPADRVGDDAAHEYFSGSAAAPAWSADAADARPVFADPAGVWRPAVTHVPGLGRYLLTVAHATTALPSANRLGVFEAPEPWGPWRTVHYVDDFLGLRGGYHLGMHFPVKWQSADGGTLWATFSCHDNATPGACGQYHDRFNMMRVTLTVDHAAGEPGENDGVVGEPGEGEGEEGEGGGEPGEGEGEDGGAPGEPGEGDREGNGTPGQPGGGGDGKDDGVAGEPKGDGGGRLIGFRDFESPRDETMGKWGNYQAKRRAWLRANAEAEAAAKAAKRPARKVRLSPRPKRHRDR
jgi:hypothetical protein